jgi:LPS O-antigen subunit length determinant protein (WzzB/FepE family)
MQKHTPAEHDEIDLFNLFLNLWEGRWKIITAILFSVVGVWIYSIVKSPSTFEATTEIKSISSSELDAYTVSNEIGFFPIDATFLQDLFIEQLEKRDIFKEAIQKFELLDETQFETTEEFDEAAEIFASTIIITIPTPKEMNQQQVKPTSTIQIKHSDKEKWKLALAFVAANAQEQVRDGLQQQFLTKLKSKQIEREFRIDDLNKKIKNTFEDYQQKTSNRIKFLIEQSAIARTLGVSGIVQEGQANISQNSVIANINNQEPFYLRGYEAIDKEIELLNERKTPKAFIPELIDLEARKRDIEQDQTLNRAKEQFALTPIATSNNFKAVSISILSTKFDGRENINLLFALAIVLGGFIGAAYVLISKAVRERQRNSRDKETISEESWF